MRNAFNILSAIVLFTGVVSGVILVQNEQDIRKEAAPEDKVTICHKTGNGDEVKKIEIAEQAVDAHLEHGDQLSGCDEEPNQDQAHEQVQVQIKEVGTPTNTPVTEPSDLITETSAQAGQSGQINNHNNSSSNPTLTQTETSTNTFETPLNKNTFNFKFKLASVQKKSSNKNVTLTFSSEDKTIVRNVSTTSDNSGVYSGVISGLETGEFSVLVKVNGYLAKRFSGVVVNSGISNWDWSESQFIVGDFNGDNILNLIDIGMMLAALDKTTVSVNQTNVLYDLDADGFITKDDVDIVLARFKSLTIFGEK